VPLALLHVPHAFERDPLVGDREGRRRLEDLAADEGAGVVRAAARRVVLAERLDGDRDARPARRPVDPPGQLAAAAHRDAAAPAAGARVIDRLGLLGEALDDRVAHLAARLTDRIERAPGGFHLPAGALG